MINLKFYPEFFCYSLWILYDDGSVENINPESLSISNELKNDISLWEDRYAAIYNDGDPANSNFKSKSDEKEFFIQGANLYNRLVVELPKEYSVSIGWQFP